jgi:regulation of enolase protein 1 (concanavalin A-like superfamily)
VVTRDMSDWSVAPVPEWFGHEVHLRISRSGDALTIRARHAGEWKLVRLCPLDPALSWRAGLFCASPSRAGLEVTFTALRSGDADESLH